jgi:hypothetical protein
MGPKATKESEDKITTVNNNSSQSGSQSTITTDSPKKGVSQDQASNTRLSNKKSKLIDFSKSNVLEKDNITIIKNNNIESKDASLINECISKHFFMRSIDPSTKYLLMNLTFLEISLLKK